MSCNPTVDSLQSKEIPCNKITDSSLLQETSCYQINHRLHFEKLPCNQSANNFLLQETRLTVKSGLGSTSSSSSLSSVPHLQAYSALRLFQDSRYRVDQIILSRANITNITSSTYYKYKHIVDYKQIKHGHCLLIHGKSVFLAYRQVQYVAKKHRRAMYQKAVTMFYIYHTLKMHFWVKM